MKNKKFFFDLEAKIWILSLDFIDIFLGDCVSLYVGVSLDQERIPFLEKSLKSSNNSTGAELSSKHFLFVDLIPIVVFSFANKKDLKALV